jgi:hypothetical protein
MSVAPTNNDNSFTYRIFYKDINLKISTIRTAFIVSGFVTLLIMSCSYFIYSSPNISLHYTMSVVQLIGLMTFMESARVLNIIFKFLSS